MRQTLMLSAMLIGIGSGVAAAQGVGQMATDPSGDAGMSGMRPMHGQMRHAMPQANAADPASSTGAGDASNREYRGGVGSPASAKASNTNAANTRSQVAPRLPDPNAESSTPEAYLIAAQRALSRGQTGAAQEALERAETRALSRSTVPGMASTPDDKPLVQQISDARQALANRDMAAAGAAINAALGDGGRMGRAPELQMNGVPR